MLLKEDNAKIENIIRNALIEDLGTNYVDVTSDVLIDKSSKSTAFIKTREDCIVSGLATFCQLEVSKSFTIPGRICTDAGYYPAEVECRHNVEYIQDNSFGDSGQDGDAGEGDSSEDGFVIQATIGIILVIGFLAVLNRGNFNLLSREKE